MFAYLAHGNQITKEMILQWQNQQNEYMQSKYSDQPAYPLCTQ